MSTALLDEARALHDRLAEANIYHLFIIDEGKDEPKVGGHGTWKWQGDNLVKAAHKIDRLINDLRRVK